MRATRACAQAAVDVGPPQRCTFTHVPRGLLCRSWGNAPKGKAKNSAKLKFHEFLGLLNKEPQLLRTGDGLKAVFAQYDTNGDGTITSTELGTVLHSMGELTTKTDIQDMIRKVDLDGSGSIDFPEFLVMMKGIHYGEGERPLDSESKASPG